MHAQRDSALSGPADPDPGSITDVREGSGPHDSPVRFAATASLSWLTAVVAVAAFAAGILLSSALLPERDGGGAGFAGSTASAVAPAPTSTASPSPTPRPTSHRFLTDPRLEAALPDTFAGGLLTKSSMTGIHASDVSDLSARLTRIAELAGGEFWSYASASFPDPEPLSRQRFIEALIVSGSPIGDLLGAYAAYSLETRSVEGDGFSCDYVVVAERRVVRCGAWMSGGWVGPAEPYWVGSYAYASGVTLYMIESEMIGSIDEDPASLHSLETIIGELP